MQIIDNGGDYDVPHISTQLADHLKGEFSADRQIALGLLSDTSVVRTEGYLLGFLAGLGYARQVVDVMIDNQEGVSAELSGLREVTDLYYNSHD